MSALWLWVLLAGLANYKASHMISQEGDDGPFDLFKKLRGSFDPDAWYGKGIRCFSCVSFWGALVAALLICSGESLPHFLIIWGAVATISFMVWRYFG